MTITVASVNDAPEFRLSSNSLTVGEDGVVGSGSPGPVTIPNFVTGIRPGPLGSGSEGQLTGFTVVPNNPALFSVGPAIDLSGSLTFTLSPDVNSSSLGFDGRIVITLSDDGDSVAPNRNASSPVTITLDITPINDAPIPDGYSNTVAEDTTTSFTSASVLQGDLSGPATAIDEATQVLSISAMQTTTTNQGTVVPFFVGSDIVSFNYSPAPNFVGNDTFTYTISDNASGTPLTAVGTITITVTAVNDAPEFTLPAVLTVNEDETLTLRTGFVTGIRPGPSSAIDEVGQSLTFDVVADHRASLLQAVNQPSIRTVI